jgi:hypothetical protein
VAGQRREGKGFGGGRAQSVSREQAALSSDSPAMGIEFHRARVTFAGGKNFR